MAHDTDTRLAWLHVPAEDEVPEEVRSLWQRADEKLYEAKRAGRNQVRG